MKNLFKIPILIVVTLIVPILFSGFLFFGKKEAPKVEDVAPKATLAILPVGHTTGRPLTAPTGKSLFDKFESTKYGGPILQGVNFKSQNISNAKNPTFVPKKIYIEVGRRLKGQKWGVLNPVDVFAEFNTLGYLGQEIEFKKLNEEIGADQYLYINITYWEPEKFDDTGHIWIGYTIQMINANGEMVWDKVIEKKLFRMRQHQRDVSSFVKEYYDRLMEKVAKDMIKDFPEPKKVEVIQSTPEVSDPNLNEKSEEPEEVKQEDYVIKEIEVQVKANDTNS